MLHESPILDDLAKEFEEKFGHLTYVECMCVCTLIFSLSYEESSVKKSPTGRKGVVQCSFTDSLPGRGECI